MHSLFFLFLLLGCSSSKQVSDSDIFGKYSYKGVYGVGSGIEFKEDKTFAYTWVTGLLNGTTEGTWTVSGKKIILNSDRKKSDVIKFKILDNSDNNSDFYNFKFLDENKNVISGLSTHSSLAVGVPGTIAGVWEVHQKFGKKHLQLIRFPLVKQSIR